MKFRITLSSRDRSESSSYCIEIGAGILLAFGEYKAVRSVAEKAEREVSQWRGVAMRTTRVERLDRFSGWGDAKYPDTCPVGILATVPAAPSPMTTWPS